MTTTQPLSKVIALLETSMSTIRFPFDPFIACSEYGIAIKQALTILRSLPVTYQVMRGGWANVSKEYYDKQDNDECRKIIILEESE